MGQIIIPSDKKVKGPWLLDAKSLEDLENTLVNIEIKLEEAYIILLDREAEKKFEEYKQWQKDIDYEQAKQKTKESFIFNESDKYILIITEQGKKIKDKDILSILKSGQINEFNPKELNIKIKKGPCEFNLEISARFDGELETRIKVADDNIFNDINYELNKWIEQHKPSLAMQKWSSLIPIAAFPILMLLFLITALFTKSNTDIYKKQLAQEGSQLLKGGLTEQETTKALEIILKIESGYTPESFNPNFTINETIAYIWIITIISLILLLIKPKTVIGLGKNEWKVKFYRGWAYFILVFIPLSIIVPFIVNKIS